MAFLANRVWDRAVLDSQTKDRLKLAKRTLFTTVTPLPPDVSRAVVLDFLHNHSAMIDLNPLVIERHPIPAPPAADFDEQDCVWYSMTDKIDYLPGGKVSGDISYTCAFHDLPDGLQTHCRAPLGVDIRDRWTLNGSMPGEDRTVASSSSSFSTPVKGAPASGLYIREDVDLRCNMLMTGFIKKNLKRSHAALVAALVTRARLVDIHSPTVEHTPSLSTTIYNATPELPSIPISPLKHSTTTSSSESSPRVSASDFEAFNPQTAIRRKPLSRTSTPPVPSSRTSSPFQEQTAIPPAPVSAPPPPPVPSPSPPPPPLPARPPVAITPPQPEETPLDSVQAAVHAHLYSSCPSALRVPVQTPPYPTGRESPTPQPHHHLAINGVPAPLRVRGSSVGSTSSLNSHHHHYHHQPQQQQQQRPTSYAYSLAPSLQSAATWDSTTMASSSRTSSYSSKNEYPLHTTNLHHQQQQQYSPTEASSSSSPEDLGPRTPPTYPQASPGPDADSSAQKASSTSSSDFPAVLRPGSGCMELATGLDGGFGFVARLNGPFIAELE